MSEVNKYQRRDIDDKSNQPINMENTMMIALSVCLLGFFVNPSTAGMLLEF